ncbi:hypothetical protein JG688_00000818 [Phytophthora aleatoria]|uniref:Uncharacterized protein n=1 Tax=Phytophthora aleatoria TaxID=2496075 RepID=A0A8J5JBZ4_9STRA|nr:hypothetical protein JG688_00000818 [Phytophthora aleatoria]
MIYRPPLSLAAGRKTGLLDYYTCEYVEPDEDDGITEELTAMLPRLHASNTMSVDELLNPPKENVLIEDPTDEDFCRVDTNSENKTRSELSSVDATGEDDEDAIKFRSKTNRYSWEEALRNTKNASNTKDHVKLKHADHPLAILAEQSATEKSMKDVEAAETDTQAVLDLTRDPEQKETTATTSDEVGVETTGSASKRFFRASEKTLNVLISKFLISQGIPYTPYSSAAFQDAIRTATGNPAFQILGRDRHDRLLNGQFQLFCDLVSVLLSLELEKAFEMEAATNFIVNLALVEMQSENLVSSYRVVFRRLAENKLKAFKFEVIAIEPPVAKDANEASHLRVLQARFSNVTTESMACVLLDPRTKSSAKKIAAVGDIPRKEEKAMDKNRIYFLGDEHRKVFAQTTKQGNIALSQKTSQSSLLSQDSSPFSSPSSTGWDDADELLLGPPIRATKTRDEVKETEVNARADAIMREWLDLEPEWLEVAQRQNPDIKIEDLSKDMSIDAHSGMHYALLGLCKHIDVLKWFRDEGEARFPSIALLARIHLD